MIFLDTTYIVSFLVDTEENHKRALKLSKQLQGQKLVITNAILTETMNLLTKKLNRNTKSIVKAYELIKNNFKIIYETKELTEKSMKTLVKYKAKIGLTDALTIEIMKELKIHEIFTFDDHFDNKEGILRVH